ncbi:5-hydroxytryptamine receptor 3A-like [Pelobates cultripes]|uniref:5-hydroxytryptamine receptor 3A-like n=1 Tax=Pelobates cultripes TaxID=61616 RepID=A0AAD1WVX1_PELCU|nr:5-hydroxytryptamine receptor 3A-like [Pelobates cultripes]
MGSCDNQTVCSYQYLLNNLTVSGLPGPDVRPVKDWRKPTTVNIDFNLYTVIKFDTGLQSLTTLIWFYMTWNNEYISWDPKDFCGIEKMYILGDMLWKPDLYIYDLTEFTNETLKTLYYTIKSNGQTSYSSPLRIVSNCHMAISKFPFDTQSCQLEFGPYYHTVQDITMIPSVNSSQKYLMAKDIYVTRGEWFLDDITVQNFTDASNYSRVTYNIIIRRAPVAYVINLIIPSFFLVLLDVASMFMRTDTTVKLGFKLGIVMGFSVVLVILNNMIPNSDSIPILGIFCAMCMGIMVVSNVACLATLYMETRETHHEVPPWVKFWVLKYLARALCFHLESTDANLVTVVKVEQTVEDGTRTKRKAELQDRSKCFSKEEAVTLEVKLLKGLLAEVLKIHQHVISYKSKNDAKSEWQLAALHKMLIHFVSVLLSISLLGTCYSQNDCSYNSLLQYLNFTNLPGPNVRPVKDWTKPNIVYVDMFLYTVISLTWYNEFISWNPDDFCGIHRIYVTDKTFWKPDILISELTNDDGKAPLIIYNTLESDGKITDSTPMRVISNCYMDMYKFPFDTQTCFLTFGSNVHPVQDIIILPKNNSTQVSQNAKDIFYNKGDWALDQITVVSQTMQYEGAQYSQVTYKITLKRASVIYVINLIMPLCFMVFLDFASMFMHLESGERLDFKINAVFGFFVLLLIFNNITPNSDSEPMLGTFCIVSMAIMVFSLFNCIIMLYIHSLSETNKHLPPWVKIWIMKHLARVLCFRPLKSLDEDLATAVEADTNTKNRKRADKKLETQDKRKPTQGKENVTQEVKVLKGLLWEVMKIHQKLVLSNNNDDGKSEWQFVVHVVDRLVLIIYVIILIIIFAVVILAWTN